MFLVLNVSRLRINLLVFYLLLFEAFKKYFLYLPNQIVLPIYLHLVCSSSACKAGILGMLVLSVK